MIRVHVYVFDCADVLENGESIVSPKLCHFTLYITQTSLIYIVLVTSELDGTHT